MRAVGALTSTISFTCRGSSRAGPSSAFIHPNRPSSIGVLTRSSTLFVERGEHCKLLRVERPERKTLSLVVSASSASVETPTRTTVEAMEVLVKAATGQPDKLGDCPFSQRVLLTLEEKNVEYSAKYVDTSNKPQWFLEANPEGKVPVIKHEDRWIADSDVITALLEDLHPEPSLVAAEDTIPVGSKIFSAFIKFLTSKDSSDGTEQALLNELAALDKHLETSGKYISGDNVTSVDLALAPKLYHIKVALRHYKNWEVPKDLQHVHQYMEEVFSRESFQKTKAPEEFVVKGWEAKVNAA